MSFSIRPSGNDQSLVVACPPPFAAKFLARRLANFLNVHPDIDLRLAISLDNVDYDRGYR